MGYKISTYDIFGKLYIKEYLQTRDMSEVQINVENRRNYLKNMYKSIDNSLIVANRFQYLRQEYWTFHKVFREV